MSIPVPSGPDGSSGPGEPSKPIDSPKPADTTRPGWVPSGSGAFVTDRGSVFYGVGKAGGISHRSLLRATADNRARSELSRVLNAYMDALVIKAEPGGMQDSATMVNVRSLTAELMKKAIILGHWSDTERSLLFSLCGINLSTVKQILASAPQLDDRLRAGLVNHADRAHALQVQMLP